MSSLHKGAKELFIAALEREEVDRGPFLADACGADTALREEVESLLDEADHVCGGSVHAGR